MDAENKTKQQDEIESHEDDFGFKEGSEEKLKEKSQENQVNVNVSRFNSKPIIVVSILSVLLIGGAITAALLIPKTSEVVDIVEAEYAFSDTNTTSESDGYGNVDWYSTYTSNPLKYEFLYYSPETDVSGYYQISGLKDKNIEEKINTKIRDFTNQYYQEYLLAGKEYLPLNSKITLSQSNILSILVSYQVKNPDLNSDVAAMSTASHRLHSNSPESKCYSLNIDLNTGEEISFDSIFTNRANRASLVYSAIYNELQTNLSFQLKSINANIGTINTYGRGMAYDNINIPTEDYYRFREWLQDSLNNIDTIAMNYTEKYLSSDTQDFVLYSSGPAFIVDGVLVAKLDASTYMNQLAYYERYAASLGSNSIYENDDLGIKDLFYASSLDVTKNPYSIQEWSRNYWFSYELETSANRDDAVASAEYAKKIFERYKETLSNNRYYYVNIFGNLSDEYANYSIWIYELNDASQKDYVTKQTIYYKSQSHQEMGNSSFLTINSAKDFVTEVMKEEVSEYYHDGKSYSVNDIFEKNTGYEQYLLDYYYNQYANRVRYDAGRVINDGRIFTDQEKSTHTMNLKLSGSSVEITIDSHDNIEHPTYVLYIKDIPNEYLIDFLKH